METNADALPAQTDTKPIIHIDPPITTKKALSPFRIFIVLFGILLFGALYYQNHKLKQDIAVLNVKLDLQAKEIKRIKSDVSDIEWETNDIKSTVESIDMKIEY
jgi:hypothetical protein